MDALPNFLLIVEFTSGGSRRPVAVIIQPGSRSLVQELRWQVLSFKITRFLEKIVRQRFYGFF